MLLPLSDATVGTSGGKAGTLGALLRGGHPVPDGFVVPFAVFHAATRNLSTTPTGGSADPDAARQAIETLPLSAELLAALADRLDELGGSAVAVRSSAANEDRAGASAAGQHDSVLAVRGLEEVASAVRTCWASVYSQRAVTYRDISGHGQRLDNSSMAVLIQRHVDADASGVMFTAGSSGAARIEAGWGLGTTVVGGTVTPDVYHVPDDGPITGAVADKHKRVDRRDGQLAIGDVPTVDRRRPTLEDTIARRLARLGQEVSNALGSAQDIEWAMSDGQIWILQARPITAEVPPSDGSAVSPGTSPVASSAAPPATLTGTPGSRGAATGTARIVRGPGDFTGVQPGDILVCPHTDPSWTPLLGIAAGVVTETGGALSHAAIVARERRIPAVLGIANATTTIQDATAITIDGTAGTVTMTSP